MNMRVVIVMVCVLAVCTAEQFDQSLKHHKMEKQIPRSTFVQKAKSPSSDIHQLVFAVHQKNLDVLEQKLKEASTPGSPKYLQWMTFEEVGKISSNPASAQAISKWLEENRATVVKKTKHLDYITATASIEQWEKLLDTEFYEWEDQTVTTKPKDGRKMHRAKEYSIPVELKEHIFGVFNTVQTPPPYKAKYRLDAPFKRNLRMRVQSSSASVSNLNSMYRIESNKGNASLSQSVFETANMYYSTNDLMAFQQKYGLTQQAAEDKNGFSVSDCSNVSCIEGNLDIQYIMGIAQETVSIYWYEDNSITDPFVLWITELADSANPPQSNSVSWGAVEAYTSSLTMDLFNTEALKLSTQGVTIVVSSGDDGAPNTGVTDACLCSGVTDNSMTSNGYNPSFPATSPYVTAVGGTMGSSGQEEVCRADNGGVITSGGGFSAHFTAQSWQTGAVASYLSKVTPVSGYTTTGRAYPDISLLAVNYPVMLENSIVSVYGTSCSAPVFAAMVSLVNAARLAKGLGSIGFLNPTLYSVGMNASSPYHYNDVTDGHNMCCGQDSSNDVTCCTTGFSAASGWDPATGWGSVNYDTFSAMYDVATPYTKHKSSNPPGPKTSLGLEMIIIIIVLGALLICIIVTCISYWFFRPKSPPSSPSAHRVTYGSPPSPPVHHVTYVQDPQAQDPQAQDPQAQDPQAQDPQAQDPQAQDPQAQDPQAQDPQAQDPQARMSPVHNQEDRI